ncbi:hypothetical protein B0H34DRAFT_800501 [Crassisporium funariophilum]|nr:hypothetical protein B0H34DRAFT_800501 [Crassisporium funariophilum]
MNTIQDQEDPPELVDKGKRRALEPTERTPLLGSSSAVIEDAAPAADSNRRLWSKLTTVFLATLSVCILAFVLLALLAWSYASRASELTPEDVINHNLVFAGPDRMDVLNVTDDGGIWMNVEGRIGLDVGSAIGVGNDPDDGVFRDIWKAIGRWGVRKLDRVTVDLSTIKIMPEYDLTTVLVALDMPSMELPLTVDPPKDLSWLTHMSKAIFVQPTSNTTLLLQFLKESWRHGSVAVRADVGQAIIRGGSLDTATWRRQFHGKLTNIRTSIHMKMPTIPGFPHPGRHAPLPSVSDVITLKSFNISSGYDNLVLRASASVVNPAPMSFNISVPSLPFTISIPGKGNTDPIQVSSVSTSPFTLTHPNVTLLISGGVLPISSAAFPTLSHFVSRYLSSQNNTILISSPLIPNLDIQAEFPSPNPRPQILKNVTIRDMKIKPTGSVFLASGIVEARVVLPRGIKVGLDVFRVLPDVIIFDGEVPDEYVHKKKRNDSEDAPPDVSLPDPLPERAFGHIRPDHWLTSVSEPVHPEEGEGAAYSVEAKVVDVPLEVLPGRQKEFSNFIGKVVFGTGGAVAGILGSAAVTVAVDGLPLHGPGHKAGEIVLSGLPFQGTVLVGKKSFIIDQLPGLQDIVDNMALRHPS